MPISSPLLLFLTVVAAVLILTGALGASLAAGVLWLDRKIHQATGAVKAVTTAQPVLTTHRTAGPGAAIFALILVVAGLLVGLLVRLMPIQASDRAAQVDLLFNTMLGIAAAIFLLVEGFLVYVALRYRRRPGDESDGIPLQGSNRLEIAWTLIPTLIVAWLGTYSFQIFAQTEAPPAQAMTVEVVSRQFSWEFRYPGLDITSPDLYLPLDQPVRLKITSADVLHSFWVPNFRIKQDAIPGRETELYVTASAIGQHRIVCAELCGVGHGRMGLISYVVVQTRADYDKWVLEQQELAAGPPDPVKLFTRFGCNACHVLTAIGATGPVGPSLDGMGTTAATRVPGQTAEDYLRESILNPNAFVVPDCPTGACQPGVMPLDFGDRMLQVHLDTLVTFLLEQK
ncbi:MAG: cytochrome c oxidase subunit II [Anaerolineales bacterium]